jgi:hypothetical protein
MSNNHPFAIGGRYRTRDGDYVVTAIDGDTMIGRFDDGGERPLSIPIQTRIWQNILIDELAAARRSDFTRDDFDRDERLVTWPVRLLVADVLRARFAPPYSPDIIDLVCREIEANPDWLRRYDALAAELGDSGHPAQWKVNNAIGWWTKDLAGMVTVKAGIPSTNGLIKSYSRLGYEG